ncbi:hypothetical protein CSPB12327_00680 [Campylobacter sp. RM12327]|uniref:hypothetical protein n=1 Tax=Campylobacter sputorum TaxID=206 RepID=UPI000B78E701|nr:MULTISPECIES: hypothetical protein [Campylobacter]ASM40366.1 hypothetical protein CSPB_1164 [Campylobacter sputorum]MBE7357361.1 hypothetical protein [Campylobacter sp. RM11302]MBF6668671.1 hypothetical protein [Campylobacter sp. RM12327]MBF6674073.1 hypothetical protein [Campylobacter sp. RM13538]MBF6675542.1 hypothetical protein [Campylobacter sp. RM12321]
MKKLILFLSFCLIMGTNTYAQDEDDLFEINSNICSGIGGNYRCLQITSKVDDLTIYKVIANRGNCETTIVLNNETYVIKNTDDGIFFHTFNNQLGWVPVSREDESKFYIKLDFGQTKNLGLESDCNLLETIVETDKGTVTHSWE